MDAINPTVRVLIRTYASELQKLEPTPEKASSIMIEKLCVELCIREKVNHLITKIVNEKKKNEHVDIIFDYAVPDDERHPEVRAYYIGVDGSSKLDIERYFNPMLRPMVNFTAGQFKSQKSGRSVAFPSFTDGLRR